MNMSPLEGEDNNSMLCVSQQDAGANTPAISSPITRHHKVTSEAQQLWHPSGIWICEYEAKIHIRCNQA